MTPRNGLLIPNGIPDSDTVGGQTSTFPSHPPATSGPDLMTFVDDHAHVLVILIRSIEHAFDHVKLTDGIIADISH